MRSEASLAPYPLITGIVLLVAPQTVVLLGIPPARHPDHGRVWPAGRRVVHRHDRLNTQYAPRGRPRRSSTTTTRRQ
jgi:hypothetical protein